MDREAELRRLKHGPEPDEWPKAGVGTVRVDVRCDGDAVNVLTKAKGVLRIVLSQSPDAWPQLERWSELLPTWFVNECAPEQTGEEAERHLKWLRSLSWQERARLSEEERWSLANWLHWFEPPQRFWFWWDATVISPQLVHVEIDVTGWPFPWDALRWLFRSAGAEKVTADE